MKKEKVLLAFSGGLDTSFCAMYLNKEKGYEVHTAIANTGGFSKEELKKIEERAYKLGSTSHVALDVTKDYYEKNKDKINIPDWAVELMYEIFECIYK